MAKIEILSSTVAVPVARAAVAPDAGAPARAAFDGVADVARAVGGILERNDAKAERQQAEQKRLQEEQDRREAAEFVATESAQAQNLLTQGLLEAQNTATGNAAGFTEAQLARFDEVRADVLERAPNARARTAAVQRFASMRASLFDDAIGFEVGTRRAQRLIGLEEGRRNLAQAAFADPEKAEELTAQALQDIAAAEETDLTPQLAASARDAATAEIAESAMRGLILQDPSAALAQLTDRSDEPGPLARALSVDQRTRLAGSARAELSRRQARQNTAIAAAGREVDALSDLVERGFTPPPERLDEARRVAATLGPDGAPVRAALDRLDRTRGFLDHARAMRPDELQATINRMRARANETGVGEEGAALIQGAERLLTRMVDGVAKDPISFAQRVGIADADVLSLDGAIQVVGDRQVTVPASTLMRRRTATALQVADHYGTEPRFLTDEEAAAWSDRFANAGTDEKLSMMGSIHDGFQEHAPAVFEEFAADHAVVAHVAGMMIDAAGLRTAQTALRGQKILADFKDIRPKAADSGPALDEVLLGALVESSATKAAVRQTADALYAARMAATGKSTEGFDEDLYKAAVREAIGADAISGGVGTLNDGPVVLPRGVPAETFTRAWSRLTDADLVDFAVTAPGADPEPPRDRDGREMSAEDLRGAVLRTAGDGIYIVSMPNEGRLRGPGPGGAYLIDLSGRRAHDLALRGAGTVDDGTHYP